MPQSHWRNGERTALVRCQISQNRTVAVQFLRAPYGRRRFFTYRTRRWKVLARCYKCSRHRTMFQPQTASHGRLTVTVENTIRFVDDIFGPSNRAATVRSPYDYGMKILMMYGHRAIMV